MTNFLGIFFWAGSHLDYYQKPFCLYNFSINYADLDANYGKTTQYIFLRTTVSIRKKYTAGSRFTQDTLQTIETITERGVHSIHHTFMFQDILC